jgi:hypothetical protein
LLVHVVGKNSTQQELDMSIAVNTAIGQSHWLILKPVELVTRNGVHGKKLLPIAVSAKVGASSSMHQDDLKIIF